MNTHMSTLDKLDHDTKEFLVPVMIVSIAVVFALMLIGFSRLPPPHHVCPHVKIVEV